MNSVVLHPLARIEYHRAYKWYQSRSIVAAERFTAAVDETLDRIEQSPESGTPISTTLPLEGNQAISIFALLSLVIYQSLDSFSYYA